MYIVLRLYRVRPGHEADFELAWYEHTEFCYVHLGSLGARLHQKHRNSYIDYAQWPDEAPSLQAKAEHSPSFERLRKHCIEILVQHQLHVLNDLLMPRPYAL